jgi:TPR repeat protein
MNFFQSVIIWICFFCACPLAKAEEDPDFLLGHALYQHGKGKTADHSEALAHFMKAAEKGHARSQFYVGRMYQLESSIGIDLEVAKKWYRRAGEKGEAQAWNNLGNIYRLADGPGRFVVECYTRGAELGSEQSHYGLGQGYRFGLYGLRVDTDKAMQHLQQAAELGQSEAASNVGNIYLKGWKFVRPDKVKAAYYFSLGTKGGNVWSMHSLGLLLHDPDVLSRSDEATLQGWREIRLNYRKQADQEALPILQKIRVAYDERNQAAACQILDEAFEQWKSDSRGDRSYTLVVAVWDEAQIKAGRANTLWSLFLYKCIYNLRERREMNVTLLNIIANVQHCFTQLGQYGLLRESLEVSNGLILQSETINVDAALDQVEVGSDYRVLGGEKLPVFVKPKGRKPNSAGELSGGTAMHLLQYLAEERLVVGDWKTPLIIAEWWERWNAALGEPGVVPKESFPECEKELEQLPMEMRMKAFASLGLPEQEAEAARQLIALKTITHGAQKRDTAQLRLFELAVDQGRSGEIDIKELESLEEKLRRNVYERGHAWKFAKLVRAKLIAKTQGMEQAMPLVREVLGETSDDVLAPLRLEALLVKAQLSLEAGITDGVAETLSQALESARSRGMLLKEMRLYELYVDYLIATDQYDAAVEMQNRVIELIKALQLTPRLEKALLRLREIGSLSKRNLASTPNGGSAKSESSSRSEDKTAREQGSPHRSVQPTPELPRIARPLLTLQPKGIRTLPIDSGASSVFLLSNLSTQPTKAALKIKSDQFYFTLDRQHEGQLTVVCKQGGEEANRKLDCLADVPGGAQFPIVLIAEDLASKAEGTVSISLTSDANASATAQESTWMIQQKSEAGVVAILDAARLTDSNFSLVPVFHQLASTEAGRTAALRVIASEPTRVEGFAADGTLLFVDAEGNGSFGDAGDLIATEEMDGLSPVLKPGLESGKFALRYRPQSKSLSKPMEIRIETRELGKDGAWKLDAVDVLEP